MNYLEPIVPSEDDRQHIGELMDRMVQEYPDEIPYAALGSLCGYVIAATNGVDSAMQQHALRHARALVDELRAPDWRQRHGGAQ